MCQNKPRMVDQSPFFFFFPLRATAAQQMSHWRLFLAVLCPPSVRELTALMQKCDGMRHAAFGHLGDLFFQSQLNQ